MTPQLAADPPGYPGAVNQLLGNPPTLRAAKPARTLYASDDADLLNPVLPEAYGTPRVRLSDTAPHNSDYFAWELDASDRLVARRAYRNQAVFYADRFEWSDTSVTGVREQGGAVSEVWLGALDDGRLVWLAAAAPNRTEWFRFQWQDGKVVFATRRIHLDAERFAFRFETDGTRITRVWEQRWRATVLGLQADSPEALEFTAARSAPRLPAAAKKAAVAHVLRLMAKLQAHDVLLLVDDTEEPAFPPRVVLARAGDISTLRERIAQGPYDDELELGLPNETLDALNTVPTAHRHVWRFATQVLRAAHKSEPSGPALGVADFEVAKLEWVREPNR